MSDLHLPCDQLKVPGMPYRPQSLVLLLPTSVQQALDQLVATDAGVNEARALLLGAVTALVHRYTQQASLPFHIASLIAAPGTAPRFFEMSMQVAGDVSATEHIVCASQTYAQLASGKARLAPKDVAAALAIAFVQGAIGAEQVALAALDELALRNQDGPELHVTFRIGHGSLMGTLTFDASLWKPDTMQRVATHFCNLLEEMLQSPAQPISELTLLTPQEREQLLVGFRSPTVQHLSLPLHRRVEQHAHDRPDAVAISCKGEQLTYRQLDERANQLAHHLLRSGVSVGSRVAVCVDPSFDIMICVLGIFKVGAVHVPLDPSYPADRLTVILEDTQPSMVLSQSLLVHKLLPLSAPLLRLDADGALLDVQPKTRPEVQVALEDTAYLIYTSGTTGKPKGVMASHANLINYIQVAIDRYDLGPNDVQPAMARFSFSITFFELFLTLVSGGKLILLERDHVLDFKRLVATLQESTLVHASPSLLRKLVTYVRDNAIARESFRSLRHVSSGGDIVAPDLLEALKDVFADAEVFVIYGCSEISCMGTTYPVPRDRVVKRSLVGKPFPNVSVRLYDQKQKLVPIGVVGEIYFSGAGITQGYLHRPDLTAEKYVEIDGERFYRTGDMGRFDAEGNLEMLGRCDFQIKLRGFRIELGDIESTLRQALGVREGIVAARSLGEQTEKSLVAYVVLDPVSPPDVKDVRRFMQAKLPDYMVPSAFVVLDALPVNINQKVDRKALPAPTAADLARLRTCVPARTDLERKLVAIWEKVLGVSPIGIEDNFFDIGGDSLSSLPLMVEIETVLGKMLPMSALLTASTIAELARLLDASADDIRPALVPLRKGGDKPALFLVHDGEGETIPYRTLAQLLDPAHPVYGIAPHSRGAHPFLHTRLSDVAVHYAEVVRSAQPHGPYLLGGLCIGGFIAFEVAQVLQAQGERVDLVALIDVAHVTSPPKSLAAKRLDSFARAMQGQERVGMSERMLKLLQKASRKISNVVAYETRSRMERVRNQAQMRLFRFCLDHGLPLPDAVKHIPVRVALRFAEKEYVIPAPYKGVVALFRATRKDPTFDGTVIDDTPYVELFDDPMLGWEQRTVDGVRVHDIPGGHSSMLQEPNVQDLAKLLRSYMDGSQEAAAKLARAS